MGGSLLSAKGSRSRGRDPNNKCKIFNYNHSYQLLGLLFSLSVSLYLMLLQ